MSALQERRRAELVLDADLRGLPEQRVAVGGTGAGVAAALLAAFLLGDARAHDLEDVGLAADPALLLDLGLDRSEALLAPRVEPVHQALGLVGADERALEAHQVALPRRHEEHVAVAQQGLGAVPIEDGAAVDLGRDAERDPAGEVRLDEARDDVHARPLRREDQVDADRARLLREQRQRRLDLGLHGHR